MNPASVIIKQIIGGPSDFGVGWLIILISSVIAIIAALITSFKWLIAKIQKKPILLKNISLLTIGTNIEYFKTLLGNPVFINRVGYYQEFIFSNPYFYIQAFINSEGKVALFSVTTRRRRFKPSLHIGELGFPIKFGKWKHYFLRKRLIKLGKTKFSELGDPEKVFRRGGDHGGFDFYSELHYFGNPGHYLNYAFSINENGYGDAIFHVPRSFLENIPDDPEEIKRFRNESAINTYTVIGSMGKEEIENNHIEFGPRRSQIRTLNE